MDWKNHDKWAQKLGISKGVSRYVNNLIDVIREGKTLPREYTDFVNKESRKFAGQSKRRVGALAMVIELETLKHDSGRRKRTSGKIASEIQLKFLKNKGEDFMKAWYLHHALDYLNDNKDLIRDIPTESIETLFSKYQKNRPVTFSKEIIGFLKDNIQELKKDLDL